VAGERLVETHCRPIQRYRICAYVPRLAPAPAAESGVFFSCACNPSDASQWRANISAGFWFAKVLSFAPGANGLATRTDVEITQGFCAVWCHFCAVEFLPTLGHRSRIPFEPLKIGGFSLYGWEGLVTHEKTR
jgi:hypothetical protein